MTTAGQGDNEAPPPYEAAPPYNANALPPYSAAPPGQPAFNPDINAGQPMYNSNAAQVIQYAPQGQQAVMYQQPMYQQPMYPQPVVYQQPAYVPAGQPMYGQPNVNMTANVHVQYQAAQPYVPTNMAGVQTTAPVVGPTTQTVPVQGEPGAVATETETKAKTPAEISIVRKSDKTVLKWNYVYSCLLMVVYIIMFALEKEGIWQSDYVYGSFSSAEFSVLIGWKSVDYDGSGYFHTEGLYVMDDAGRFLNVVSGVGFTLCILTIALTFLTMTKDFVLKIDCGSKIAFSIEWFSRWAYSLQLMLLFIVVWWYLVGLIWTYGTWGEHEAESWCADEDDTKNCSLASYPQWGFYAFILSSVILFTARSKFKREANKYKFEEPASKYSGLIGSMYWSMILTATLLQMKKSAMIVIQEEYESSDYYYYGYGYSSGGESLHSYAVGFKTYRYDDDCDGGWSDELDAFCQASKDYKACLVAALVFLVLRFAIVVVSAHFEKGMEVRNFNYALRLITLAEALMIGISCIVFYSTFGDLCDDCDAWFPSWGLLVVVMALAMLGRQLVLYGRVCQK